MTSRPSTGCTCEPAARSSGSSPASGCGPTSPSGRAIATTRYLVFKVVQRLGRNWRALNGGPNLMQLVLAGAVFKGRAPAAVARSSPAEGGDSRLIRSMTGNEFPHFLPMASMSPSQPRRAEDRPGDRAAPASRGSQRSRTQGSNPGDGSVTAVSERKAEHALVSLAAPPPADPFGEERRPAGAR